MKESLPESQLIHHRVIPGYEFADFSLRNGITSQVVDLGRRSNNKRNKYGAGR